MAKNNFWKDTKLGFILTNLLVAITVVAVAIIVLLVCLRNYTEHNIEIDVPNITELYLEEAKITLEAHGLYLEVIDSTYSKKAPLGTIVEQNPAAGSKVKHGRTIYAIQNARFRRPVILPELRDVSLRQAQTTLSTLGLHVDSIEYEPSTYRDIILDIRVDGIAVLAGTRLTEDTPLTLVVGQGKGTEEITIPSIVGKSLSEARSWLLSHRLTLGVVEYDVPPTEENVQSYIVYSQSPASGTVIVEGSSVNVKLSLDIEKIVTADNEQDEEEFF